MWSRVDNFLDYVYSVLTLEDLEIDKGLLQLGGETSVFAQVWYLFLQNLTPQTPPQLK